ncbi:MAG: PQQ-binding-like beta-propeller repeat protein [Anaerolineae bacterium]
MIFPAPFTCVREGDILAAVGDPRPAPHLHFEIRTNQPDIPGPGYTWEDPVGSGWRRPSKFVANWQAWLLDSYRWHADIADEAGPIAPPVELSDHSLITLDAGRVLRVSSDGRVLWRVNLSQPAVGLIAHQNGTTIAFADGKLQNIDAEGNLGAVSQINLRLDSPPIQIGGRVLFHTPENSLISINDNSSVVGWQLEDIPPILRWATNETTLALMTADNAMLLVSVDGQDVRRSLLREPGSLAVADNDDLLAYTRGGLWDILLTGTGDWSLAIPDAPPGGRGSGVAQSDQQTFLFDGETLHAYDLNRQQQWAVALPGVGGTVSLSLYGGVVLLTSTHGDIIAVQASSGGVCNATRIYGGTRSREWHSLGDDGILRVYVADQIVGLAWDQFLMACG